MQKPFDTLKQRLTTAAVLAYQDFNMPFASSAEVGAILSQLDGKEREHLRYYASRSQNKSEKNHSTYERGGLAIVLV